MPQPRSAIRGSGGRSRRPTALFRIRRRARNHQESDSAADSNTESDKSKSDTSVAKSEPVKSDTTEKKTAKESKKDINKRENTTGKSGSKAVDV